MNYKWFIGIDLSKSKLDVALFEKEKREKSPHKQFSNNTRGYLSIIKWISKNADF